jgi:hypothetical protein
MRERGGNILTNAQHVAVVEQIDKDFRKVDV